MVVEGVLLESERRGRFGPTDPDDGTLEVLARVDLERVAQQVDYDVLPGLPPADEQRPGGGHAAGRLPSSWPLGLPEPTEGPHLAYAVQWFIFTTIAVVGYALLLRRVARDEAQEEAARAADVALDRELQALLDAEA